jgi:hypothetical protein
VWACLAAAVAYVLAFDPTDNVADPAGACAWHAIFGINGPTCGGTRMVWFLLHGDLVQAGRHHLVALIGVPFAVYALIGWTARVWLRPSPRPLLKAWPLPRFSRRVYILYSAFWLLYAAVLRNLPWQPFSWFDIPNLT